MDLLLWPGRLMARILDFQSEDRSSILRQASLRKGFAVSKTARKQHSLRLSGGKLVKVGVKVPR